MVGITSFGAYVPFWRLDKSTISAFGRGEKAVCNFDEDSITMAVAAGISALGDADRSEIDGCYFASASSPFSERQAAATVAAALDLSTNIRTADFAQSLRSGTTAILTAVDNVKAGSAKKIIVTASDARPALPSSAFEQSFGDGAAAVTIGDTNVIAEIIASSSVSSDIMDYWRASDDEYTTGWDTKFCLTHGYMKLMGQTIGGLMKKEGLAPGDFAKVCLYSPDERSVAGLAQSLGFNPKTQLQDTYFNAIGNSGTPSSLQFLCGAFENAKAGDKILLASYGDGCDAIVLQVTSNIEKVKNRDCMGRMVASKKNVPDYVTYLKWRGKIPYLPRHKREEQLPSAAALLSEKKSIVPFKGAKCNACGTVQWPPQRLCTKCSKKDDFTDVRLSDKKATLFTHSLDVVTSPVDVPLVYSVVNFEGGGRIITSITDKDPKDIKNGMELVMTFRRLQKAEGFSHYFWKAMPPR